ncbi:MAG: SDR family oxidoreductase [Candidatus Pseudobacter hemicellulosilyticus]|uniref:SDR family oxidoreductase n=1 Tax=Candidatus Pseudobacter hemicellulosilyticus TaxID=3121375 RepID=A0AAJ5WW12_9BACT|nr:MAG: SDR family oxidoreductase [Pseudobacter sp.]
MSTAKIGVTGATGQLGQKLINQLKALVPAEQIVALVRTPEKAADLGVEVRAFDYTNPALIGKSLRGIERLVLISSNEVGQRSVQHSNVINAAKAAGVKYIVYTSLLHADTTTLDLAAEHLETEAALAASGIAHTILRNGWYTENYTGSVPGWVGAGAVVGSAGEGKISSASREDFALAAAKVVSGEGHEGKVYELAGDEAYTLADLAAELSRQTGKEIPYKNLSKEEYTEALKSWGVPAGFAGMIAGWDIGVANGDLFDDSKVLSNLIGRSTTPFAKTVAAALEQVK